jgi:hypothetical protein
MTAKTAQERLIKETVRLLLNEAKIPGLVTWPDDVANIPFYSDADAAQHIGPGERRVAKIVDGKVVGGSVSYDIVDSRGGKWEVKAPDNSLEIKTGVEGKAALAPVREKIERVCNIIADAFSNLTTNIIVNVLERDTIDDINKFIENDIPQIKAGELSGKRMDALIDVMLLISDVIQEIDTLTIHSGKKYVALGVDGPDIEFRVGLPTYIKIGLTLDLDDDDMNISAADIFKSKFDEPEFRDPGAWYKNVWNSMLRASQVFGHVDGIFFVNQDGYRFVKSVNIDNVLKFVRITRGSPVFKIVK